MREQRYYKVERGMPKSFMMKPYLRIYPCFWHCLLSYDLCVWFGPWVPIGTTDFTPWQLKLSSSCQGPKIHNKKRKKVAEQFKPFVSFCIGIRLLVSSGTCKTSFF